MLPGVCKPQSGKYVDLRRLKEAWNLRNYTKRTS
jgi:hypothetical protein